MEPNVRTVSPEELIPPLLSLLDQADSVPLVITGNSMSPFLVHGRDTVFLSRPVFPLKKGDMILYRRAGGAYVLHRICKAADHSYCLLGDAQTDIEPGIRREQVLAMVTAVRRKGKLLHPGSLWWEFFRGPWLFLRPVRRHLIAVYSHFK